MLPLAYKHEDSCTQTELFNLDWVVWSRHCTVGFHPTIWLKKMTFFQ